MKADRRFDCPISGTSVLVTWRSGAHLMEPSHSYVRCSERDCQYVDLNQPPCPLNVTMLEDTSYDRIATYLGAHAGPRVCYACVAEELDVTHAQVRRATWRLKEEAGLSIRPARCAVCRRRRSTMTLPARGAPTDARAVSAALSASVEVRTVVSKDGDVGPRVLGVLTAEAARCAACVAFAARVSLAEARGALAHLREGGMLTMADGVCDICGRNQSVSSRAVHEARKAGVGACGVCGRPIRAGGNVIAVRGGVAHLACWLETHPPRVLETQRLVEVVDDHDDARRAVSKLLEGAGFRVVDAGTARRAVELLETTSPDVCLLDLHLPDADGFKLCRVIKRMSPTTQVLPVTGVFCRDEHRQAALDAGAEGFLTRPVDNDVLVAAVSAMIGQPR